MGADDNECVHFFRAASQELYNYLVERLQEPRMLEMLVACQEVEAEEVEALRSCGEISAAAVALVAQGDGPRCSAAPLADEDAACEEPSPDAHVDEKTLLVVKWATGVADDAVALTIARDLPPAVLDEQVLAYDQRVVNEAPRKDRGCIVYPHLLKSRMQIAKLFDEWLSEKNVKHRSRLPIGIRGQFCRDVLKWPKGIPLERQVLFVSRWHKAWMEGNFTGIPSGKTYAVGPKPLSKRARDYGGGRRFAAPWLREALFEWWSSMRHSIDWRRVTSNVGPQLRPKKLARFTRTMMRQKAQLLISQYCAEHLRQGKRPRVPKLSSEWWKGWKREYGLSFKKPNRKYKVPRWLVAERLRIGWVNVARVRAAVAACFGGHDPCIENWDQSPFHHNESGSADVQTLGVVGATCPLVEGHADTRKRWTANLTTWSSRERVLAEGPPPIECMFKGGDQIKASLEEHIRSCGYGP